jgi:hypothetical protein
LDDIVSFLKDLAAQAETEHVGIKAVHDDDLPQYLHALGIRNVGGSLGQCKFCHEPVTLDNLAAIFPESGSIKLVCHQADCLLSLQELVREGRARL